ncbi:MAG: ABC transporter ATP-binding protein [Janthinobacterium lividum]
MPKPHAQTTCGQVQPILQVNALTLGVGGAMLHGGISFALRAGELVAVVGPSGSGKTTLLRTIVGLQPALAGAVTLEGRDGDDWGWPEFRRRVVLVAQKPVLFDMTVEENLRRPFAYHAARTPYPEADARRLLNELGVGEERLNQPARQLSVGQQQRIALIRALLLVPPVLCLDEPTSALDPETAARVQELLSHEAAQRGLAALIVTHSPQQARDWCERRIEMPAGRRQSAEAEQ